MKSRVRAPFFKIKSGNDIILIFLNSMHQSKKVLCVLLTFLLSHACSIAAQMLLCRNRIHMVKADHIPSGSNAAKTNDRTIL